VLGLDDEEYDEDVSIVITEKGILIAQAVPAFLGYGLTARQIMNAFGIYIDEEDLDDDEEYERLLGIVMYTARYYGVIE